MNEPMAICTCTIVIATIVISFRAFRLPSLEQKLIFHPESILAGKEYYRLVSSVFLHSGWNHLLWNMLSLYLFGTVSMCTGTTSIHPTAPPGVCGVIFAHILLLPGAGVNVFILPIAPSGWLYAIIFLLGSFFGLKHA